ncbi:unnamed protein product [Boreogadus saida]
MFLASGLIGIPQVKLCPSAGALLSGPRRRGGAGNVEQATPLTSVRLHQATCSKQLGHSAGTHSRKELKGRRSRLESQQTPSTHLVTQAMDAPLVGTLLKETGDGALES